MTYTPILQALLEREPESPVVGREIEYTVEGTACTGYFVAPDAPGPFPAVLVLADWLGVGDVVRMRADMLARIGYAAFVGDVYGGGLQPSPADAPRAAGAFYADHALWRSRLLGAYARMCEEPLVDIESTAAIGYCFGGSGALQLARTGADLRGVVTVHGGLGTGPAGEAAGIRSALLILTGAADPLVPDADVVALKDELRTAPDVDWQVIVYSGAMHAFAVPTANDPEHGAQFDPVTERRSWVAMKAFLAEVFA